MGLITIKTFPNAIEAHLLRTKLESEGIPCFVFDENIIGMNPFFNIAVGGVKLKIDDRDEARVKLLLETEFNQE